VTITAPELTIKDMTRVRDRVRRQERPGRPQWNPPAIQDFALDYRILAFDPALLHMGWVSLERLGHKIEVFGHGTLNQSTTVKGFEGTLLLAEQLVRKLDPIIRDYYRPAHGDVVVIEMPAVAGHRLESSQIAGLMAWQHPRIWPMNRKLVSALHASSVLCGNPRHDKTEITRAVLRYIPQACDRGWSQHQRDAAAVGLAYLHAMAELGVRDIEA
jgi:Holliday junction resolvasome RuvABC endonuclease subunit